MELYVDHSKLSLQSAASNASGLLVKHTLSQAPTSIVHADSVTKTSLVLTLAEADSIALELIAETAPTLFTGTADTYVVIENGTFKDAANVSVVTTGAAVQVGTFTS
jgi:hypothetical protein